MSHVMTGNMSHVIGNMSHITGYGYVQYLASKSALEYTARRHARPQRTDESTWAPSLYPEVRPCVQIFKNSASILVVLNEKWKKWSGSIEWISQLVQVCQPYPISRFANLTGAALGIFSKILPYSACSKVKRVVKSRLVTFSLSVFEGPKPLQSAKFEIVHVYW